MNMHLSFAVLAYGQSPYIEDCILSLLRQTQKSPIVITTSTPSDFLFRIGDKYELPVLVNPIRADMASDWNFAVKQCSTQYLTLAHQDDIYYPRYTECFLAQASNHNDCQIVFSNYQEMRSGRLESNNLLLTVKQLLLFPFLFKNNLRSPLAKTILLSLGSPVCCPSVMYNLGQIGRWEFDPGFSINLDWDTWLRLARREGRFVHINKPLMAHRIYEDSTTSRGIRDSRRSEEDFQIFRRIHPEWIASILHRLYRLSYSING